MVWDVYGVVPVVQFQASPNHLSVCQWARHSAPDVALLHLSDNFPLHLYQHRECVNVTCGVNALTLIRSRQKQHNLSVFILKRCNQIPFKKTIALYGMTLRVCTLLLAKDLFEVLVSCYLETVCTCRMVKEGRLQGIKCSFPK